MEDVVMVLWGFEGKLRSTFHKVYWKEKKTYSNLEFQEKHL